MTDDKKYLGRLIAESGTSAVTLQRAAIIAVLSFLFFLVMTIAFYIRQNIGYFVLATAFLLVYLLTLYSWVVQRRSGVKIYENGLKYKRDRVFWSDVESTKMSESSSGQKQLQIELKQKGSILIPSSITAFDQIAKIISDHISFNQNI